MLLSWVNNMWETYGETTKNNVVESIENMFLMEQHMSDYGVSITDEDKTKITDAQRNSLKRTMRRL